jgi:hypothetical protein
VITPGFGILPFSSHSYILKIERNRRLFMAAMTAQEAAEQAKGLTFEKVWAIFQEVGQKQAETDRQFKETAEQLSRLEKTVERISMNVGGLNGSVDDLAETDRPFQEAGRKLADAAAQIEKVGEKQAETAKNLDRLEKTVERMGVNVGGLNGSVGDLVETLFAPHLGEKFDAYGYKLRRVFHRVNIYDETSRLRSDIDILLSDTTLCMTVEVKRWLDTKEKVDDHIKRMQLIRAYPPAEVKGKKILGAIVGAVVHPEVREYAEQNGFFVLELTGEDVRLLEPPEGFKPKEW